MNIPTTTHELVARAAKTKGLSMKSLAEQAGMPYATLHRRMTGVSSFTVAELLQVAAVLKVEARTLVGEAASYA